MRASYWALYHSLAVIARLGHVSPAYAEASAGKRPRVTQIMSLLLLAPDIQEAILFLPLTISGRDRIVEGDLKGLLRTLSFRKQRLLWAAIAAAQSQFRGDS